MTLNDIPDDIWWDSKVDSDAHARHIAASQPDEFPCPACSANLWDRERGLCTCLDPVCLACHKREHRPGQDHRCVICGDLAVEGARCVRPTCRLGAA